MLRNYKPRSTKSYLEPCMTPNWPIGAASAKSGKSEKKSSAILMMCLSMSRSGKGRSREHERRLNKRNKIGIRTRGRPAKGRVFSLECHSVTPSIPVNLWIIEPDNLEQNVCKKRVQIRKIGNLNLLFYTAYGCMVCCYQFSSMKQSIATLGYLPCFIFSDIKPMYFQERT